MLCSTVLQQNVNVLTLFELGDRFVCATVVLVVLVLLIILLTPSRSGFSL